MVLRLVRCPYCRQRFNVAGAPTGARIQCTFCASALRVPERQTVRSIRRFFPRTIAAQISVAGAAGLFLALGVYFLVRPAGVPQEQAALARVEPARDPSPEIKEPLPRFLIPDQHAAWLRTLPRAKKQLLEEFGAENLATREAYPFLVAVEEGRRFVKTDLIDDYASRLQMLHRKFRTEFAAPLSLPNIQEALPVVILNSRESYDRYCKTMHGRIMPEQITGMYEYARRRIVMYHDAYSLYQVVFHEGTHQLIHHYSRKGERVRNAYWFQEGMGTYFEGFRRSADGIIPEPTMNRSRLPAVQKALKDDSFVPVDHLVKMTIDDFWKWFDSGPAQDEDRARMAQLYYAESWALVYFMMHAEEGRYREAFRDYFYSELQGEGTIRNFKKALRDRLDVDLSTFQAEFIDYIKKLS